MDCADIKVEMSGEGLLDPLVIVEEGDETQGVASEGSPAFEEDLGDREQAAAGEKVALQKGQNEGQGSDRQNGSDEGDEEEETAAEDVNIDCSEAVKVERSESCEQQLEGMKSHKEDPNKVSRRFLFSVAQKKRHFLCHSDPQRRTFNDSACGSVFVCSVLQAGESTSVRYFAKKSKKCSKLRGKNTNN